MAASGALLLYLMRNDNDMRIGIKEVLEVNLESQLSIDEVSLAGIKVWERCCPSRSRQIYCGWEGEKKRYLADEWCSLAHTAMGRRVLLRWILSPTTDMTTIKTRQDFVTLFIDNIGVMRYKNFSRNLKSIKDTWRLTAFIRKNQIVYWTHVRQLLNFCAACDTVCIVLREWHELHKLPAVVTLLGLQDKINTVWKILDSQIDIKTCRKENDFVFLPTEQETEMLADLDYIEKDTFLWGEHEHFLRYFNALPKEDQNYDLPPGSSFMGYFFLGLVLFVHRTVPKPNDKVPPTDEFGFAFYLGKYSLFQNRDDPRYYWLAGTSPYTRLKWCRHYMAKKAAAEVLPHLHHFKPAEEAIGELDAYLAFARLADDYRWTIPTFNSEYFLKLKQCRRGWLHDEDFIPFSYTLEKHQSGLLTAPGRCGKSTLLRSVGVTVLLAHVGSRVPAIHAEFGNIHRIRWSPTSCENMYPGLSNFHCSLYRLNLHLDDDVGNTLLLMDCFGIGTKYSNSQALLYGAIRYTVEELKCIQGIWVIHAAQLELRTKLAELQKDTNNRILLNHIKYVPATPPAPPGEAPYIVRLIPLFTIGEGVLGHPENLSLVNHELMPPRQCARAAKIFCILSGDRRIDPEDAEGCVWSKPKLYPECVQLNRYLKIVKCVRKANVSTVQTPQELRKFYKELLAVMRYYEGLGKICFDVKKPREYI